jgi:hypothetical protein
MIRRSLLSVLLATSPVSVAQDPAPTPRPPAADIRLNPVAPPDESVAKLTFVADDRRSVTAAGLDGRTHTVKVRVADLLERLKAFKTGDVVKIWVVSDEGDLFLRHIEAIPTMSGRIERILVLAIAFIVLLVLISLLYRGDAKALIVGFDGRYSKSKFQMAVWFAALFASYVAAVYLRARYSHGLSWGGVNIPQNLLLISGLSALSFAGAKGITASAVNRGSVSKPQGTPSFPGDLLYADDNRPDFGDFQMLVVTALATFVFLGSVVAFLGRMDLAASVTLPDIDTTILSAFGLGQGAYLAKKALGTPAPGTTAVRSTVE